MLPRPARDEARVAGRRGEYVDPARGRVTLAEVAASTAVVERTPRLIRRDDPELYKFGLQVSGSCVIEQGGREAQLGSGDFAIYDCSRPYTIVGNDPFRMLVCALPHDIIIDRCYLRGDPRRGARRGVALNSQRTAIETTRTEFNSVRTGRASAALLDRITIDYYGTPTPLKNMATIGAPEARLLTV